MAFLGLNKKTKTVIKITVVAKRKIMFLEDLENFLAGFASLLHVSAVHRDANYFVY